MSLTDFQVDTRENDIYEFIKDYFNGVDEYFLRDIIHKHWEFGTIDAVYRDGKVIACCRWNVNGYIFDVLDLVISDGENGRRIIKHLIARNWNRFPQAKYIRFIRENKYPGQKPKIYSINKILGLRRI